MFKINKIYLFKFYYLFYFVLSTSTSLPSFRTTTKPTLSIWFNATYQNKNRTFQDDSCRQHYGVSFMNSFTNLRPLLRNFCADENIHVNISSQATIYMTNYRTIVSPQILLGNEAEGILLKESNFEGCRKKLVDKFLELKELLKEAYERMGIYANFSNINDTEMGCVGGVLKPYVLLYDQHLYLCPNNYTLDVEFNKQVFCRPKQNGRTVIITSVTTTSHKNLRTEISSKTSSKLPPFTTMFNDEYTLTPFVVSTKWRIKNNPGKKYIHLTETDHEVGINMYITLNYSVICPQKNNCPSVYLKLSFLPFENLYRNKFGRLKSNSSRSYFEGERNMENLFTNEKQHFKSDPLCPAMDLPSFVLASMIINKRSIEDTSCMFFLTDFSQPETPLSSKISNTSHQTFEPFTSKHPHYFETTHKPHTTSTPLPTNFEINFNLKALSNHRFDNTKRYKILFEVISIKKDTNDSYNKASSFSTDYENRTEKKSIREDGLRNIDVIETNETNSPKETLLEDFEIQVVVESKERAATCQSINDPHIITFDGLEYNNFLEGEFVLYQHTKLPFKVHALYQKCASNIEASCNCGVAVMSGDDVIVIEKCVRKIVLGLPDVVRHTLEQASSTISSLKSFNTTQEYTLYNTTIEHESLVNTSSPSPPMPTTSSYEPPLRVKLYLNGKLTRGTYVRQDADGKKYYIYLPHGMLVKAFLSGCMLNLWVVPSIKDHASSLGLCGKYDWFSRNDLTFRNNSYLLPSPSWNHATTRPHPLEFLQHWRVSNRDSLFEGVRAASEEYEPKMYTNCGGKEHCFKMLDVDFCSLLQGKDVTAWLLEHAQPSKSHSKRRKRNVKNLALYEPFLIDNHFMPPSYQWSNGWNRKSAIHHCTTFILHNYTLGNLCSNISSVNFSHAINNCVEDILITGRTDWAVTARDAMKEECVEGVQMNSSLSHTLTNTIKNINCFNDCSGHGVCLQGKCHCDKDYTSVDCSVLDFLTPQISQMPSYGLCDTRYMNCSRIIVYGKNFQQGPNLTCHLQESQIDDRTYRAKNIHITSKAFFLNFNAVECPIPEIKSYLLSISNNGKDKSDPLLFIPFDSACGHCFVMNTTCVKKKNSCIIDNKCYLEGERSKDDTCLICKAVGDEFQWSVISDNKCIRNHYSDWLVALLSAVVGSVVGGFVGLWCFKCCFKNKTKCKHSSYSTLSFESTQNSFQDVYDGSEEEEDREVCYYRESLDSQRNNRDTIGNGTITSAKRNQFRNPSYNHSTTNSNNNSSSSHHFNLSNDHFNINNVKAHDDDNDNDEYLNYFKP